MQNSKNTPSPETEKQLRAIAMAEFYLKQAGLPGYMETRQAMFDSIEALLKTHHYKDKK